MNILIVEDDPNLRLLWDQEFSSTGHRVVSASTAIDARAALLSEPFDMVLVDLYLGKAAGQSLADLAASSNGTCRVVMITGTSSYTCCELYEMSPAVTSVLRKPIDIEHLAAVCDHIGTA